MNDQHKKSWIDRIEWSAILTVIGVILLFSTAVIVTLIAPEFIDPSWMQASSSYQIQMFQNSDPNVYIAKADPQGKALQYVYHLRNNQSLLAFNETKYARIVAPKELEGYITKIKEKELKLTQRLLLLRTPQKGTFDAELSAKNLREQLQKDWKDQHADLSMVPHFEILELYAPDEQEAFAISETDGIIEHWVDENFSILENPMHKEGTIYIQNPQEFRIRPKNFQGKLFWQYDALGEKVKTLEELKGPKLGFLSRQELINIGEDIYKIEGCWYCHTDQTRTLIQDTVANGTESFPAPPSSANEYIFDHVTFPGTRRIGPDMSREGIKKPSRDWHRSHFWSPKTESPGTIMPAFRHFFENDPRGSTQNPYGVPNYRFEAIYQYLMIKGTRITPPNQAWWLGKDPINTIKIIEGKQKAGRQ